MSDPFPTPPGARSPDGVTAAVPREPKERAGVFCDEGCEAFDIPVTDEEIADAYEHWRYHGFLSGCSHGN